MKKLIISIIWIVSGISIYAQDDFSYTEAFDSVFVNISRTDASTGILYERVIPFAQLHNFNSNGDTSYMEHFVQAYFELYKARFLPIGNLPFSSDSLASLINTNSPIVDIGILHYKFNAIDSNIAAQKLYVGVDSVLFENTAVTASLYLEKTVFIASPLKESVKMGTVCFRFRDMFQFDNTGNSIVSLMVDFDDGNGLQSITDSLVTVNYTTTNGIKTLRFEALLSSGEVLTTYAAIYCTPPPPMYATFPESDHPYIEKFIEKEGKAIWSKIPHPNPYDGGTFSKAKGEVWIYYANSEYKLKKPVLIVDGFDPENLRTFEDNTNKKTGGKSIWQMLYYPRSPGDTVHIGQQLLLEDYDLVVLDFPEGGIYIEQNAMVCIEVINWINRTLAENESEEEIVVIGPSMGGQISRYALAYMEKNKNANTNYGNHNCRLWVSFDSPHQGAHISMGAQALIYHFANELGIGSIKGLWSKTLNSIAAQQMLVHHRNQNAYLKHNKYYNTSLRNVGYPENLRKIAISNGSLNNTSNHAAGQKAFDGTVWWPVSLAAIGASTIFGAVVTPIIDINLYNALNSGKNNVFVAKYWIVIPVPFPLTFPISKKYEFNNNTGKCSPDAAPGSYYNTYNQIRDAVKKTGATISTNIQTHCFMPITSVLDISSSMNFCTDVSSRDLVAEGKTPFASYWGPTGKNMDHISFDNSLATWVLREIDTYTQGPKRIEVCETQEYSVHLPNDVSSSTQVIWTCSKNLRIVSGQNTKTISVKALSSGEDTWVQATVGSLTHSNLVTTGTLAQSKKQLKKYYITVTPATNCPVAPATINNTTVWNTNYELMGNLSIESGATLTINRQLFCAPNAKIIVNPGGKLIINGGVLTNACNRELWQGIEVWGSPDKRQDNQYQGVVELKNGARLENAVRGIYVGKREAAGNPRYSGGIVYASDAHFINCNQAVYFAPYQGDITEYGYYPNNKSYFKNCEFVLDNNAIPAGRPVSGIVELYGVRGVLFQQSTFRDSRTNHTETDITSGIYACAANIRVGTPYWSSSFSGGMLGYDGCNFFGLEKGIHIEGSNGFLSSIYFSVFDGTTVGIDCWGSNGGLVVNGCEFTIPSATYGFSKKLSGIFLDESSGYSIENNLFIGSTGTGLYIKKSGTANHIVKNNTFEGLCSGCVVVDENANEEEENEAQGVVFLCNSFNNKHTDISISENGSISRIQSGNNYTATGNTFYGSGVNIHNRSNKGFQYYYYESAPSHHLSDLRLNHPSVVGLIPQKYISCISNGYVGDYYYKVAKMQDISILEESYIQMTDLYSNAKNKYLDNGYANHPIDWENQEVKDILSKIQDFGLETLILIPIGETEFIVQGINIPEHHSLIEQVLLYVELTNFRQIMDDLCYKALELLSTNEESFNIEQYRTWLGRLPSIESKYRLVDNFVETKEFDQVFAIIDQIPNYFTWEELDQESYHYYRDYLYAAQEYYHCEFGEEIPSHIIDKLVELSNHDNLAGKKSYALLKQFDIDIERRYDDPYFDYYCAIGLKSFSEGEDPLIYKKETDIVKTIEISVYPNPANNILHIKLDKFPQASVNYTLYDIQGKELSSGSFEGQKHELNISHISKGIYFIRCTTGNQPATTKKVIKE